MKTFVTVLLALVGMAACAWAHPQAEHLKEAYRAQGDALFVPLYWLPETRPTVLKHLPNAEQWVGFEPDAWKQMDEGAKLKLLEEIGAELERLAGPKLDATWKRLRDWPRIASQLALLAGFLDQDEGFLDLACRDPLLRPAFQPIIDRRPAGFDTKFIGSTLSSGEMAAIHPMLTEHLLNTAEAQRLECFARLFAQIAQTKSAQAEP